MKQMPVLYNHSIFRRNIGVAKSLLIVLAHAEHFHPSDQSMSFQRVRQ